MSAELMKSKFVRRPSVVRLWHRLSLKLLHGFLSNLSCGFPWAIWLEGFFFFFWFCLRIFFMFVNIGPYGSQNFKMLLLPQSLLNSFKLCLNFLLSGSHNSTILDFWNFDFFDFSGILFVFVNMGPYGSQNFKTLLLPHITFELFQTFLNFLSQGSSQKYFFGFLKFWVFDF